jgi:NhaA family Na+:H+ antiporter
MRRRRIWWTPLYVVVGFGVWLATFESGIHATIAGVALGLIAPARPSDPEGAGDALREASAFTRDPEPAAVRRVTIQAKEAVSIAERLEHMLHPWTSFGVIPIFALANAGVRLNANILESATSSPVTLGIIAGLVAGKLIGIITFSWASTRLRIGAMPEGMTWHHLVGGAAVAGIGFTVSLFIAGLAFADQRIFNEAMIGIFAGSIVAALVGVTVLMSTAREG